MFSHRQGNFVLKIIYNPSIFLLIHGQNNYSAQSVKIALQSASKIQGKDGEFSLFRWMVWSFYEKYGANFELFWLIVLAFRMLLVSMPMS